MKRKRAEAWRRRRVKTAVVLVVLAVILTVVGIGAALRAARFFLERFELFAVREVRVLPAEARPAVLGLLNLEPGQSLLFLDLAGTAGKVAAWNQVERYRILRVLPSRLEVRVELRRPWMRTDAPQPVYFDRAGVIVPAPAEPVRCWAVRGLSLRQPLDEEARASLAALRELDKWYNHGNLAAFFAAETVVCGERRTLTLAADGRRVLFLADGLRKQCEDLRPVLEECRNSGMDWEYIDMRFTDPYVKKATTDERGTPHRD